MYYYVCLHRNTVLYLPKDITLNFHRSGATSTIYIVTTSDNSAVGDYTCMVTVSTVESSESPAYSLSATGIVVVVKFVKIQVFNLEEKFVLYKTHSENVRL